MPIALKDVGQMSCLLGVSPLAASSLWGQPVGQIHPVQLDAFIARYALDGSRDLAETAVQRCLHEIAQAVIQGELAPPPMLAWCAPCSPRMSAHELSSGLTYLGNAKGAAVVFALETGLDAAAVGRLTWRAAQRLFRAATLSEVAIAATRTCPRHLHLQYVFWQDRGGMPAPLFSLDHDVYDAFGLVWAELAHAYERLR